MRPGAEKFKGSAKVGIIEGLPSAHTTERMGGFVDKAKEKYPDIQVVASQPGDWEREKGMNAATNMLQANPDITVFFGLSHEMELGAIFILSSAYCPAFTTVRLPVEEASRKACALLLEQMEKQMSGGQIARFDTKLIIRETTRR